MAFHGGVDNTEDGLFMQHKKMQDELVHKEEEYRCYLECEVGNMYRLIEVEVPEEEHAAEHGAIAIGDVEAVGERKKKKKKKEE